MSCRVTGHSQRDSFAGVADASPAADVFSIGVGKPAPGIFSSGFAAGGVIVFSCALS
jgi:hypothetical protein